MGVLNPESIVAVVPVRKENPVTTNSLFCEGVIAAAPAVQVAELPLLCWACLSKIPDPPENAYTAIAGNVFNVDGEVKVWVELVVGLAQNQMEF